MCLSMSELSENEKSDVPKSLVRKDGSKILIRRSWSHLTSQQRTLLEEMFTHSGCSEICPVSGFKVQKVFGINYPPFIPEKNVAELRQYFRTLANDIFVVAYPKCGMQWVLSILSCLKTGKGIPKGFEKRFFPWPEKDGFHTLDKLDKNRRIFKSHAPVHLAPWKYLHPKTKIIYIMRNPKDLVVSFHKHAIQPIYPKRITPGEYCDYTGGLDSFFQLFVDGKLPFGDYFEHVAAWRQMAVQNPDQVFWLNYENVKLNFVLEVTRLAKFCELMHDVVTVERVKEETSFKNLKLTSENAGHFRKGVIGDWKNHLSHKQAEYLDTEFSRVLDPLGLKNQC